MPQASKSCFLVVDVQNLLVEDCTYRGHEMLDTIKRLLAFCRKKGVEIVYVRHEEKNGALTKDTEPWQIYSEVAPLGGERVFDKRHSSSFYQTGLKEYLREKGIQTIILAGMETGFCINATVQAGFEHGFEMLIPESGHTAGDYGAPFMSAERSVTYHNALWDGRFGRVLRVEDVEKLFD
ncbi:MAG TPA: cysteine hydrolase family protein [Clostridia bacterium]|nr:cysteine hydrolase family protein [Clostridia bacterium]